MVMTNLERTDLCLDIYWIMCSREIFGLL